MNVSELLSFTQLSFTQKYDELLYVETSTLGAPRQTQIEDSKHQRNRSWRLRKWVDDVQIAIFNSRILASCGRRCLNSISLSQPSYANCKQCSDVLWQTLDWGVAKCSLDIGLISPKSILKSSNSSQTQDSRHLKTQLNESQWCKTAIWIDLGHILVIGPHVTRPRGFDCSTKHSASCWRTIPWSTNSVKW